ncbi:MAG: hypothetical protein JSV25_06380 [Spirochaetota bacterium]|nr:MAG: hypothetical protein JSV25_06380 [Spirochaetota bacterium]
MTHRERVRPPSRGHKVETVINITDRAFKRNLHSMVHTYLKLRGKKKAGTIKDFYPPSYKAPRRKLKRTA